MSGRPPSRHNTNLGARIGFLTLTTLLMVIGVVMTSDLPITGVLGVRTAVTTSDPAVWHAVNGVAGLMLAFWGWIGLAAFSQFRIRSWGVVAFAAGTVALLAIPVLAPQAFVDANAQLTTYGFKAGVDVRPPLAGPLLALATFAAIGNVLRREHVQRNGHFGFRLKALLASDAAWERGNRRGGLVLQVLACIGLFALLLLLLSGYGSTAFVVSLSAVMICPLAAAVSAHRSVCLSSGRP